MENGGQTMLLVWKKYMTFETLHRKAGDDLNTFVAEWQKTREVAESVGCQYSDLVLACKLVEKANLSDDMIVSLLSEIETTGSNGGSVLTEILIRIENYSYRDSPHDTMDSHDDNVDIKVPCEDYLHDVSSNNSAAAGFGVDVKDDFEMTVSNMKSCMEDSKPPLKTCPQCNNLLLSENDEGHFGNLEIVTCDVCNDQLFAKAVLNSKKELSWEYLVLPKCTKCEQFLELKNSESDLEDVHLFCKPCDIIVNSIFLGKKLVTLKVALSRKGWGKKSRKKSPAPREPKKKKKAEKEIKKKLEKEKKTQDGNFQCEICGRPFARLNYMLNHLKTHSTERLHKCEHCQKSFRTSYDLKLHLNIHTREKVYICSFCGKKFIRQSTFAEHVNIHTKAKSYDCDKCSAQFVHRASLVFHVRVHHTGERPYKCDQCDRSFYTNFKLRDHKRIHTGERPFKCKYCDRAFGVKTNVIRHMKKYCKGGTAAAGGVAAEKPPSLPGFPEHEEEQKMKTNYSSPIKN